MEIKDFRYLFENTEDGIIHSGCVGGGRERQETNFVYACGVQNTELPGEHVRFRFQKTMEPCHIFVLASFSSRYIPILLEMVRLHRVKTVLLPYFLKCFSTRPKRKSSKTARDAIKMLPAAVMAGS